MIFNVNLLIIFNAKLLIKLIMIFNVNVLIKLTFV